MYQCGFQPQKAEKNMKKLISSEHYLLPCRLDNWIRLLSQNGFHIRPGRIPQALWISLVSLVLSPFALAEALIYGKRIKETKIEKGPLFVIGHWRSGTTYLQNVLSRDPQFGWFDPVHTTTFSNSLLLGWLVGPPQRKLLKNARPMDNLKYGLDLPMEEVFAQANISTNAIIQMLTFPRLYRRYFEAAFVTTLPEKEQRDWFRSYRYIIKKMTYACGGRTLILKSPDNTCRAGLLLKEYPGAKFINIHREPYVTIMSTINMFRIETDVFSLNDPPEGDYQEMMEDAIIEIFERMYRGLFALEGELPKGVIYDIAYDDFVRDPVGSLKDIYGELGIDGFEDARPRFESYIESLGHYKKNHFELYERLRKKINAKLGFYFEHYGYEMRTEEIEEN